MIEKLIKWFFPITYLKIYRLGVYDGWISYDKMVMGKPTQIDKDFL